MIIPSAIKGRFYNLAIGGVLLSSLIATGCQYTATSSTDTAKKITHNSAYDLAYNPANVTTDTSQQPLKQQALRIQRALANKDFSQITQEIHPARGVRFSMYAYIQPNEDKNFSREQFAQYLRESNIRFTWGQKDGTGDLLITPLPDYLTSWVNAATFNQTKRPVTVSVNDSKAAGNSINNLNKIYQNSDYVEFYHEGSEEYSGMDWRAMRLVFDEYQGKRYLVAIISDQWTI